MQPASKPIAIVNATLLTVARAGTITGGTVLTKGGRGRGKNVAVPPGASIIDGQGKFVTPGIIDCHSHTAIVSDSDSKARNLPYEAAMARAYGLPPDVALRAITLAPAEILGVADKVGSLAEGKDANVVIATGDIMDHRTAIKHVLIDGVEQPLSTRHARLYEPFKDRK